MLPLKGTSSVDSPAFPSGQLCDYLCYTQVMVVKKESCGHRLLHGMIEYNPHALLHEGGPAVDIPVQKAENGLYKVALKAEY